MTASTLCAAGCGTARGGVGVLGRTANETGREVQTVPRSTGTPSSPGQLGSLRPPPLAQSEQRAPAGSLEPARQVAARFLGTYVPFLYGHVRANRVLGVSSQLGSRLRQGAGRITPAERSARPRIVRITVESSGPPVSATAIATVLAHDRRYRLTATLEPRNGGWVVIAVEG
jgi:hypothetical protein